MGARRRRAVIGRNKRGKAQASFTGILLAVPCTAILKVVVRVVVARSERMAFYTGEKPAP